MRRLEPFERYADEYDAWFDRCSHLFESELLAVAAVLPRGGDRVEIGVGTGRFAARLGISVGVEPARAMSVLAQSRGIEVREGTAEALPFEDAGFDVALLVTTLCFVDDIDRTFAEAYRVLRENGRVVVAFIPQDSAFGRSYAQNREEDRFFRYAQFFTVSQVEGALARAGFAVERTVQTLTLAPGSVEAVEAPSDGHGRGSFVVIRAAKTGPVARP